jgi:hypothetical protein
MNFLKKYSSSIIVSWIIGAAAGPLAYASLSDTSKPRNLASAIDSDLNILFIVLFVILVHRAISKKLISEYLSYWIPGLLYIALLLIAGLVEVTGPEHILFSLAVAAYPVVFTSYVAIHYVNKQ